MQERKDFTPKLFYELSLDCLVPQEDFYRKVNQHLELHFLYKATAPYYGREGQQSIGPVVFFKILLVGYLNNINSDRALLRYCADSLSIRLFLGYDLDEELPWHSTISRTRQLYGEEVFLSLFQKVLSLCVQKGMVRGKRQCVDSAYIKANASMDSLLEKEVVEDVKAYVNELEENSEFKVSKDSAIFSEIMDQTLDNLSQNEIEIEEVLADADYSSGESLQYCQDKNINAYIPNFGQYKPEREGFVFNKEENRYECIKEGGNKAFLPFKRIMTDSKGYQKTSYRSSEKDCGKCPLRAECCGKITKFKKIEDSLHKPLYDQMHEKLNKDKNYTRFLTKRRSSTVEPVLGTLINHHNMKRINSRGMAQANKHVLMAALTYNLKKYLKFTCKTPRIIALKMTFVKGLLCFLQKQQYSHQNRGYKLS